MHKHLSKDEQIKRLSKMATDAVMDKGAFTKNLCAKQTTIAIIVNDGKFWVGTNSCRSPQDECPRDGMPTGVGYDKCREVCRQYNHAEVNACHLAGKGARGGTLYLIGHTYCCDSCQSVMNGSGIKNVIIVGMESDC